MAQKEFFQTKYGLQWPIEKTLFHGTNEDSVENIWRTGFNRSYAGKNATAFGRGVYFATNSCYSHHYTDIRKGKFFGHMFVCNVLIGKYAVGKIIFFKFFFILIYCIINSILLVLIIKETHL